MQDTKTPEARPGAAREVERSDADAAIEAAIDRVIETAMRLALAEVMRQAE